MDIQTAIQKRDQLKVNIGIMENRLATILGALKEKFGTDDVAALTAIRTEKANELASANARRIQIEAELDTIFSGA